ncbi:unnamed protein product [Tilletia controversa]|uniref:Anaphase-promoting complex subunit 4-like WD40 domain-containing protein n=3 Tax=Tilletia TaxID=13289 RepID=A0A8X7MYV7_9BASI|nr:hypothetical protein CF328_g1108 [Tilletia controversa]CAD6890146.1 unnamed protein product [Tilletia caries]CAD6950775.1 unnamed protein product [Tilletia laevis]KAE8253800.1 hypothetical protein A4X06_0g1213 [Tilletia controversa]CAD6899224.1 unnamed protein product [Tilletia controversa]
MDFTHSLPHSSSSCLCFSPGSTFLAYTAGTPSNTVIVCRSDTLQVASQWTFDEYDIQQLQWSDDGLFLHATNTLFGIVFVLSPDPQRQASDQSDDRQGWLARLEAGYEGIATAAWAPSVGPPTILTFSLHQLRFTAYDLANQGVTVYENPKKAKILRAIKLPEVFAVLEIHNETDQISIYGYKPHSGLRPSKDEPSGWLLDHSFPITTNDASEVLWSPDGNHFAVTESILEYKLVVYTSSGVLRATLAGEGFENPEIVVTHPSLAGSKGSRTTAIKNRTAKGKNRDSGEEVATAVGGLGIRCMSWSPSGQMLAVGGYDEKIRVLEATSWRLWSTIDVTPRVISQDGTESDPGYIELCAFREPAGWLAQVEGQGIIEYQSTSLPLSPPHVRPDFTKPNPKVGIAWMDLNEDETMLACRNEALPSTVFIYHLPRAPAGSITDTARSRPQPRLIALLVQAAPIKSIVWRPRHYASLYLCCGGPAVYSWKATASGTDAEVNASDTASNDKAELDGSDIVHRAECIAVPSEEPFSANEVRWSPDGRKLLVIDNGTFCCAIDVASQQ